MVKIQKKDNALIKQNRLVLLMKKEGIKRASSEAVCLFEELIERNIQNMLPALKEEMIVHGRKTLKVEDVNAVREKKENKSDSWEI